MAALNERETGEPDPEAIARLIGRAAAIVFDFDGVLAESVDIKTTAFATLYREHGAAVEEAVVAHHLAHGGISRHEKFRHYEEVLLGRPLTPARAEALADGFARLVKQGVIAAPPVAGAPALLAGLAPYKPLFVASGTPEEELQEIVAARGDTRFFRALHGSPRGKAEILRTIAAELGARPDRLLMVGDAASDHDAAAETGAGFIGRVPPGDASPFPAGTLCVGDMHPLAVAAEALFDNPDRR